MPSQEVRGSGQAAPPTPSALIDDQHPHEPHPAAHAPEPTKPPDHSAMAAYVDHDHHAPQTPIEIMMAQVNAANAKIAQATAAAHHAPAHAPEPAKPADHGAAAPQTPIDIMMAQVNAINAKLIAQGNAITQQVHAQQQIKSGIDDGKAVAMAAELASYSRGMNDKHSRAFIQRLDEIDDPALRTKVKEQFQAQTGQSLEGFIRGCHDWNNNGENRDREAALQLISKERDDAENAVAKMSPAERAKKEEDANKAAIEIRAATTAHDHSDENMQKIFRNMETKDPAEMELLRAAMRRHGTNLYQAIDDGTHKGDEDEAIAMLTGDKVKSAQAALMNEDDPKRLREVIGHLSPAQLKQLGPYKPLMMMRLKNPADRAEIGAALDGDPAAADAERLGNILKPKKEGMKEPQLGTYDEVGNDNYDRRKPKNVLKEFESMSGDQVKAAAAAWDKAHPGQPTFESMLEARWGDDDDKTELNRLKAMIHGDKGLNRSLRMQEGMREKDQDEIEGALAHDATNDKALQSQDADVRKKAEAVKAENDSFERNNVEADRKGQQWFQDVTGHHNDAPAVGRSTKDQLGAYYDARDKEKAVDEDEKKLLVRWYGPEKADQMIKEREDKKKEENLDHRAGAEDMHKDGKLSDETQVHRGKGAKEKAEALENIKSNKELDDAQARYKARFGKEMLPETKDERSDMNANELMIDNVRLYGVKAERPAQLEYQLQVQQYEKQYSSSLESSESYEAGGGTQQWQRYELEAERKMLKDPKVQVHGPTVIKDQMGMNHIVEDPNEPAFDQIQTGLPKNREEAAKLDDGLKDGVTKKQFNQQDAGMTAANKAQEGAKKRLAERICKILSTIAKIAAALTAQPELIALIDIGEGLLEMAVKHEVMGESYDPAEDAKMLAFTAAADVALMGLSKVGKIRGAAVEVEAAAGAEKTAMEVEHAATGEAKAEALSEGAHAAAGESSAMKGAIEEGTSAEKALSSEAADQVGHKVEQKAADAAEGKALHEGESAAAKEAVSEAEHGGLAAGEGAAKEAASPAELAKKIEAHWALAGGGAKMMIQTVGGGIVQGKSPSDILKGLVTGGLGLVLPGHFAEKVKAAIGNDGMALKVLGELASFGTEVATNTTINVAGGAEGSDALIDSAIGAGGGRAQRVMGAHGSAAKVEEHAPAPEEHAATSAEHVPAPKPQPLAPAESSAVHEPLAIGEAKPVEVGAENTSLQSGDAEHRVAANTQPVIEVASGRLGQLDEGSRAKHAELFASAENRGHQVMYERALAAGRSYEDLVTLQGAMAGKSEAQVMLELSGAGLVQFYKQSCVPASYQIALAERDPLWALQFRSNPEDMMAAQRNALMIGDSQQTQRPDLANAPENLKQHAEDPGMGGVLKDQDRYSTEGSKSGMDPADMKGQALHKHLEAATGEKYEVLTSDTYEQNRNDGTFSSSSIPHERIGRALDAQKPVLFGANGHERVLIGREVRPDGQIIYIVTDPHDGTTKRVMANNMMGMDVASFVLPREGEAGPAQTNATAGAQVEQLAMGGRSEDRAARAAARDADPGGRGNWHTDPELVENLDETKAARLTELESRMPKSPEELEELVRLREEAAGGTLPRDPGTPEHMHDRWQSYDNDELGDQEFDQWAAGHPSRMANSKSGVDVEKEYREALFNEAGVAAPASVIPADEIPRSDNARQVDLMISGGGTKKGRDHLIQIKSGEESLTTSPKESGGSSRGSSSLSNKDALATDGKLIKDGHRVTWVMEERASGPLIKEALAKKVEIVQRVDAEGENSEAKVRELLERAGMTPKAIQKAIDDGKLVFVVGDRSALIEHVVSMAPSS